MLPKVMLRTRGDGNHGDITLHTAYRTITHGDYCVKLRRHPFSIAVALLTAMPNVIHRDTFLEMLWGDDPEGGPDSAHQAVQVYMVHVRKALEPLNLRILTAYNFGWFVEWGRYDSDRPAHKHVTKGRSLAKLPPLGQGNASDKFVSRRTESDRVLTVSRTPKLYSSPQIAAFHGGTGGGSP